MKNPFENMFNKKKVIKGTAIGLTMMAALENVDAQNNNAEEFIRNNNLNPKWDIDMSKYPGMHPAQAFEIESYNQLDLFGKIQWTKDAIRSEKQNLELDLKMGESEEQIKRDKEEIKKLEQQLSDLERQNRPSV